MYIIYDKETGIVDRALHADLEQVELNLSASETYLEVEAPVIACLPDYSYVSEGLWVRPPKAPSPHHKWDWETKSWGPNLDSAKAAKKAEIEAERDLRINEPLIYDGKVLDADQAARDNLKAKLEEVRERIRLNIPMPPELLVWRDNANQTHAWPTIEGYHDWLSGYAIAMSERGTRIYGISWSHKAAIEDLETLEEILNYSVVF